MRTTWKEEYKQMKEDLPQNDAERQVLHMLGHGESVIACYEAVRDVMSHEEFLAFMKRADECEREHFFR